MILGMEHLMGAAEIGKLFGVGRQRVFQLTSRDDFPRPEVELAMGKVWRTEDVRRWGIEHGRQLHEDDGDPVT
jgi:predicted DNA-binding transcriptional regulator AlpA